MEKKGPFPKVMRCPSSKIFHWGLNQRSDVRKRCNCECPESEVVLLCTHWPPSARLIWDLNEVVSPHEDPTRDGATTLLGETRSTPWDLRFKMALSHSHYFRSTFSVIPKLVRGNHWVRQIRAASALQKSSETYDGAAYNLKLANWAEREKLKSNDSKCTTWTEWLFQISRTKWMKDKYINISEGLHELCCVQESSFASWI